MADNFEQLGFQVKVDGAGSAVSNLDRIVERLERIQKLQGKSIGKGSTSSKGGLSTSSKLTDEERWDKQYQDKMRKQAYYLKQGYVQQKNIISDHTKWVLAEEKKLEKKRFLTEQGYIHPKTKKVSLTDEEKYTQRVARSTQLLNSAKYEELRRTELANQQRKKEIDQRLKQELGIKKITKSLGAYLGKLTAATVIAKKLGHLVVDAVNESAKYIENLNLFAVAFGDTYQQTLDWALDIADAYGLASNEVVRFAGVFRELSTSLGLVDKTADTVTKALTNYGYDLSALFNVSVEQAMEKLQSGIFSGNVRPLRAFGIDISQNQIDNLFKTNEALASMGVNARNLSQSDKVIARLVIALQSGTDAFGTMYREINNLQSQFRIFQGSLQNFKLAVGDLVQQPIADAMVYINAFIIAMTDIIRAFVPLKTIDETPVGNLGAEADEASQALDNLNGKLADFDKFNVLGGQSSGGSQLTVTEALNKLLEKQVALYEDRLTSAMEIATNQAKSLSNGIRDWFIVVDEEGNFVEWTNNAKLLGIALKEIGLIIAYVFGKKMITSMVGFFTKYITNIQELRLQNALATTTFQKLQIALNAVINGVLSLTMGIAALIMNWDNMSDASKFITIFVSLAAAIGAAAAALYLFKQNYAMAIGVGATVLGTGLTIGSQLGSMSNHADGGYTNANLIMTHENGKREWVGKAAGSSAIVNDTQMSDIMEVAVAKGVVLGNRALNSQNQSGSSTKNIYNFNVNGRTLLSVMEDEMHKQGKTLKTI